MERVVNVMERATVGGLDPGRAGQVTAHKGGPRLQSQGSCFVDVFCHLISHLDGKPAGP